MSSILPSDKRLKDIWSFFTFNDNSLIDATIKNEVLDGPISIIDEVSEIDGQFTDGIMTGNWYYYFNQTYVSTIMFSNDGKKIQIVIAQKDIQVLIEN